jgi:hypothetical protein
VIATDNSIDTIINNLDYVSDRVQASILESLAGLSCPDIVPDGHKIILRAMREDRVDAMHTRVRTHRRQEEAVEEEEGWKVGFCADRMVFSLVASSSDSVPLCGSVLSRTESRVDDSAKRANQLHAVARGAKGVP